MAVRALRLAIVTSVIALGGASCTTLLGVDRDYVVGEFGGSGAAGMTSTSNGGTAGPGGSSGMGGAGGRGGDAGSVSTGGGGGGATCWAYRRRLTFDNSGQAESLSSFPVLVVLDGASFDYAHAEPDGADLRFRDADDTTELAFHIERWDPTGSSYVWVRVPTIDASSTDDYVWMYYGRAGAPDAQDEAGTYDDTHVAVFHLDEPSGPNVDSVKGISCNWQGGGSGTQDALGQIAGADDFDGVEDALHCGYGNVPDMTYHTVTAWVRLPLTGDEHQEVVCSESTDSPYSGIAIYVHRSDGAIGKWLNNTYRYGTLATSRVPANQWTFIALRGHQSNSNGYIQVSKNGGAWEDIAPTQNTTNLAGVPGTELLIGKWPGAGSAATRGTIDEVRISNVARSDEWVRAEYLSSANLFVTQGDEEHVCP